MIDLLVFDLKIVYIVYDGRCPFCSRYVDYLSLQQKWERVKLIDARDNPGWKAYLDARGADLNGGMAVLYDGDLFFGADAIRFLAVTPQQGLVATLNAKLFSRRWAGNALYFVLRHLRLLYLHIAGIPRL
jgi:predicted DCC family thiol-disulfide oxidoreductase YuxK